MALYLVIHKPQTDESEVMRPPSRLTDLARVHGQEGADPRWLKTWSPDLHDDRIFTLWESATADAIIKAIHDYGFLDNMEAQPIRVDEWGPAEVIATSVHDSAS